MSTDQCARLSRLGRGRTEDRDDGGGKGDRPEREFFSNGEGFHYRDGDSAAHCTREHTKESGSIEHRELSQDPTPIGKTGPGVAPPSQSTPVPSPAQPLKLSRRPPRRLWLSLRPLLLPRYSQRRQHLRRFRPRHLKSCSSPNSSKRSLRPSRYIRTICFLLCYGIIGPI